VIGFSPPGALADYHEIGEFRSGEDSIDDWLRRRARANQLSGASRTYFVREGTRVAGYSALASGVVTVASAPGRFRRNVPNPIPVAVLARLAVDRNWQGQGIGHGLFRDAAIRVANASDAIGIRGIVVHAIPDARNFDLALGFDASPVEPMTLIVTLTICKLPSNKREAE
jgi:GNAT superfamily N-acetyltransferase